MEEGEGRKMFLVLLSLLMLHNVFLHIAYFLLVLLMEYCSIVNMLTTVHLNFPSYNPRICVMSESGSDVCFLSSDSFSLTSSMPCNFWLKARHDVLGNRN